LSYSGESILGPLSMAAYYCGYPKSLSTANLYELLRHCLSLGRMGYLMALYILALEIKT
jgi:hypothetical protein